jgi:GTP-binding protein
MFVDKVQLKLSAGKGGNGVIAWRREKYIPKGGPAGGDGGKGGAIYLQPDVNVHSLEEYRNRVIIKAESGGDGGAKNWKGKDGKDLILKVPCGTLVKNPATNEIIYDLTNPEDKTLICKGGKGGKGNSYFKTSTHQAPFHCTQGTFGEIIEVELELKLIADVGFVGMPNAGKSTLISKLAHISVKIAPYPFTTLKPNLGIVEFDDYSRILIADIPGIIENASENKGLGLSFLRHIERTSTLVYVIELSPYEETRDPLKEFEMLRSELSKYSKEMLEKPFLVVLNKIDQEGSDSLREKFISQYPYDRSTLFEISALNEVNLDILKSEIKKLSQRNSIRYI